MPPEPIETRLQRMLGILVEYDGDPDPVPLHEVTERFHCSVAALERDCLVASRAGRPPCEDYLDLLNVVVDEDDDTLTVWVPDDFGRPARLTSGEALALLTAAATLLALQPDDEALASAVDKVRARLGIEGDLAVAVEHPAALDVLLAAHRDRRVVVGRYWSAHRDVVDERHLEPHMVFLAAGAWYARCRDRGDGAVKLFRLDRFEWATLTDDRFDPEELDDSTALFRSGPAAVMVTVRFPADAGWVAESLEVTVTDEDDEGFTATLAVVGTAWLANLLLRTGGQVVEPASLRGVAADVARRALAHYAHD